jgi:hypothetical protein
MKKKTALLAIVLVFTGVSISAQPRALGLRLSPNVEFSLQQYMNSESNMIEVDFGSAFRFNSLQGATTYSWLSTSRSGNWTTYAGLGIGGGYTWGDNSYYQSGKTFLCDYWTWGVVAVVGIDYKLYSLPLVISLDYRPLIGADFGHKLTPNGGLGVQYHFPGLWNFGVSARLLLD